MFNQVCMFINLLKIFPPVCLLGTDFYSGHQSTVQYIIFFSYFKIEWMKGSKLNICYNTLDRQLEKRASQVAFHWEGNDPKDAGKITYAELHKDVCKFANVLRSKGVKKVCIIYCKPLAYLVVQIHRQAFESRWAIFVFSNKE